jgi:ribosomal protein S18 acetylase RimI-like enzyme
MVELVERAVAADILPLHWHAGWLADRRLSGDLLLVALHGPQVVAVAAADPLGHLALVAVDPSWQRQGIGRALVRELARGLARAGGQQLTTRFAEGSLLPGAPPSSAAFFESLGFAAVGRECTMRAPLRGFGAPRAASPAISLATLTPADLPDLLRLAGEIEPAWVPILEGRLTLDDVVLARHGDALAGFCVTRASQPRSYFGPMGVDVRLRRQGIGTSLTWESLQRLERSGAQEVELWTDADSFLSRRWYPSFGFVVCQVWINFECPIARWAVT